MGAAEPDSPDAKTRGPNPQLEQECCCRALDMGGLRAGEPLLPYMCGHSLGEKGSQGPEHRSAGAMLMPTTACWGPLLKG